MFIQTFKSQASTFIICRRISESIISTIILFLKLKLSKTNDFLLENLHLAKLPFKARRMDLSVIYDIVVSDDYWILRTILKDKPKVTIVDGGANIGLFSLLSFSISPCSIVYAFEASQNTYSLLNENVLLNAQFNWKIYHRALWDNDSYLRFIETDASCSGQVDTADANQYDVQGITLNQIKEITSLPIDVLKLDIEGAEEQFLVRQLCDFSEIHNVLIELHPDKCNADDVVAVLKSNYQFLYYCGGGSFRPLLLATNQVLDLSQYDIFNIDNS